MGPPEIKALNNQQMADSINASQRLPQEKEDQKFVHQPGDSLGADMSACIRRLTFRSTKMATQQWPPLSYYLGGGSLEGIGSVVVANAFHGGGHSSDVEYPISVDSESQSDGLDSADEDSEYYYSDELDSDDSAQSHETQKKAKWCRSFFEDLNCLTHDQLQEHDRQWHCPVCKGGVGAIDWYRGLGPLVTHARTVRSRRVKVHRSFADILSEELQVRGSGVGTGGQSTPYGMWKGLSNNDENALILWPPMVIIENTKLELDDDEKWIGMGNNELLDTFKEYNPWKARHAYGPQGHRGMSMLIFPESPGGYHDAQRLHKHFTDARRSRDTWDKPGKLLYLPGGSRILYGYLAIKEDIDIFNRHNKGKAVIKPTLKRLQEVVLDPMRAMQEQFEKVLDLQTTVEKEKAVSKTLKKTVTAVARNLRLREKELGVLQQRAEQQMTEHKQRAIDLEGYFNAELELLRKEVQKKEAELQKANEEFKKAHLLQFENLESRRAEISKSKDLSKVDHERVEALMEIEITREAQLVERSINDAQAYESQRQELQDKHHELQQDLRKKQHADVIALEMQLQAEMKELMTTFRIKLQHPE